MPDPIIFCISLEAERDRRLHAIKELKRCGGLHFELIDAIDGREGWGKMRGDNSKWGVPLKPTEAGCYFSHLKALQRIVDYDLPHAIITEDDFGLEPDPDAGMREFLSYAPENWDHIQLHATGLDWNPNRRRVSKEGGVGDGFCKFWRMDETSLLTLGYAITNKLARIILDKYPVMTMPIDHLFARLSHWPASRFYEIDKAIVGPRDFGSVICP